MQHEPQTFRDHMLSIYQSAVEQIAHKITEPTPGARPGLENPLVRAAAQICALRAQGVTAIPEDAPPAIGDQAWTCARLGFAMLEALARGDGATAAHIEGELRDGTCDLGWTGTLVEYAEYFGPDGTRRSIPYITPEAAGLWVVKIPDNARIALIADWGTGTPSAVALLQQVKQQKPDILIHLGDIYYSGTPDECDRHFRQIIDDIFDRANTKLPVFNMPGNHDMYSGGEGYYRLISTLNPPPWAQKSSFFCLRSANKAWQFLAMDTGLHDYNPLSVTDVVTFVDQAEEAWHLQQLDDMKGGQTILLSHHQLFSAFSQIGQLQADGYYSPCNPKLLASLQKFKAAGRIAAWFWGHEHNLCVYQPYAGLDRGRCIGHGAIPVLASQNPYAVLAKIKNPPDLVQATRLGVDDAVYAHGFTIISLDSAGGPAKAEYYLSSSADKPIYVEMLGQE
jgi:hypothetical protein